MSSAIFLGVVTTRTISVLEGKLICFAVCAAKNGQGVVDIAIILQKTQPRSSIGHNVSKRNVAMNIRSVCCKSLADAKAIGLLKSLALQDKELVTEHDLADSTHEGM